MIKKFRDLSEKEQRKFLSNDFMISEKLDMVYFKLSITSLGVFALKTPKFTAISDVDCACNSIYKDIIKFAKSFEEHRVSILEKIGECTLGFFYLPVHKTKVINYYTLQEQTFILSDVFSNNPFIPEKVYEVLNLIDKFTIKFNTGALLFKQDESFIDSVITSLHDDYSDLSAIGQILIHEPHLRSSMIVSNLPCSEIEGLILKNSSGKQYQLVANNTQVIIDKDTKKIYRDIVLSDLSKLLSPKYLNNISNSKDSYINKITNLFLDFINSSDIFSKYKFDKEDFLPPIDGYIGEFDIDVIENEDVKTICKIDPVKKNILRLFLHTFTNTLSNNKFKDLPANDAKKLNDLILALKYKNYAEIARQHSL